MCNQHLFLVSEAEAQGDESAGEWGRGDGRHQAPPLPLVHSGSLPLVKRRPAGERTGGNAREEKGKARGSAGETEGRRVPQPRRGSSPPPQSEPKMAAGAAAAERRRRRLLGREGAKGASCPPTSHSSLLGFSPSVLPLPPTRAAERARPPARAGVELGSSLAARTNHRLRPPRAPASPCALAQGRLRARPPAPSRPLSSRLRRGPSRVPPAARAPASSSSSASSFLPLPRPHRHQPPPRPPPPPPPPAPPRSLHPSRVRLPQSPRGPVPFRRLRERGREGRAGRAVPTGAARVAGGHP